MNTKEFWAGEFGDEYTKRNVGLVENNYRMFEKIFSFVNGYELKIGEAGYGAYKLGQSINSIIEFGAGSGMNIQALKKIFPLAQYTAVEINKSACDKLKEIPYLTVHNQAISGEVKFLNFDLVLCKGILIHIPPEELEEVYQTIYDASNKYILLCEYYSPARREIPYRGERDKLWAFDFIKPMIDKGCKMDYGFVSKYDEYAQDDITWALFYK